MCLERFSYDLENENARTKQKQQTNGNKNDLIGLSKGTQTRAAFGSLSERSDEKTSYP